MKLPLLIPAISATFAGALLLLAGACSGRPPGAEGLDAELRVLDATIKQLPEINRRNQRSLDSLASGWRAAKGTRRIQIALDLSERYRLFNADSSLFYADAALTQAGEIGNSLLSLRSRLSRITTLATLGIFAEAQQEFSAIEPEALPEVLRQDYYYAGRTLFGYIAAYLNDNSSFCRNARYRNRQYDDSLIAILPPANDLREFLVGENLVSSHQYIQAEKLNLRLLSRLKPDSRLYAMTAFQLATCYRYEGEPDKMLLWLAKAATGDLKSCVRDGLALPMLANHLYTHGQVNKAYHYINVSLQDASLGALRWRAFAISAMVPAIDNAYHSNMATSRRKYIIFAVIATLGFLVSLTLLWFLFLQRRKLQVMAIRLDEKRRMQNSYIGNFIAMCATYAERLNHLLSAVDRKLSAGDADGLRKMIKSGKFLASENDEFYTIFDNAFLDLYPDFVKDLNGLLRPEEQLVWKKGKALAPEIRIYALVCLGVNESTRIAQILRYSVSTVYAYRNRMRNRAKDRDSFESNILTLANPTIEPLL